MFTKKIPVNKVLSLTSLVMYIVGECVPCYFGLQHSEFCLPCAFSVFCPGFRHRLLLNSGIILKTKHFYLIKTAGYLQNTQGRSVRWCHPRNLAFSYQLLLSFSCDTHCNRKTTENPQYADNELPLMHFCCQSFYSFSDFSCSSSY